MPSILRRANEQQASEWAPIPKGVWRFELNPTPELKYSERYSSWGVRFPLILVPDERERLTKDHPKPPAGMQQSYRTSYRVWSLSLGYFQKSDGQYRSTNLIDFLEPCVGHANMKRFHEWILNGGGPKKPADPDDPDQELEAYREWLGWFEGLEIYGSIRHEEDKNQEGVMWARFGGPMAVGSLPHQKEDEYQAVGRGKLRSMIAEWEESTGEVRQQPVASEPASKSTGARVVADRAANGAAARERTPPVADPRDRAPKRKYEEVFDDDKDVPF